MPSTYTNNLGIELPADGELDGSWGDVVNDNMNILDRAINGSVVLSLSGTTSTLTTSNGTLSDGQYKALILGGSPSGTHTITISPNDAQKIYFVYNLSGQSAVFTQGSGTNVTVANGDTGIIYSNGGGGSAGVVNLTDNFAMNSVKITGGTISGVSLSTSSATITGGTINGTTVGASTASSGAFTTLAASGATTLSGATALSGTTTLTAQLGLGGANYGTAGQVLTSQGAGSAPAWANSFPSGGIILWSGSVASIPSGWLLCDGSSGTPDLRNRFVVGAGSTYAVGATGGADTVTLSTSQIPSHTHTFSATTSTNGAHTHTYQLPDLIPNGERDNNQQFGDTTSAATTSSAGDHNHTVSGTTAAAGSGGSHENRPPYYALAYIMKA